MKPYKGSPRKAKFMRHIKRYWTMLKNKKKKHFKSYRY